MDEKTWNQIKEKLDSDQELTSEEQRDITLILMGNEYAPEKVMRELGNCFVKGEEQIVDSSRVLKTCTNEKCKAQFYSSKSRFKEFSENPKTCPACGTHHSGKDQNFLIEVINKIRG